MSQLNSASIEPNVLLIKDWQPQTDLEVAVMELVNKVTAYVRQKGWLQGRTPAMYFVGGYPRDLVFHTIHGRSFVPHDIDLATPLSWDQVREFLRSSEIRDLTVEKGVRSEVKNLVHHVLYADSNGLEFELEITSFRGEKGYTGHQPEQVWYTHSMRQDASRRDFTINALYFDPYTREVIDFVGGIEDIRNKTLRVVGDINKRLVEEDPLRMLRYVRFMVRFRLNGLNDIRDVICANVTALERISRERVRTEMEMIFKQRDLARSIDMLARLCLLDVVIRQQVLDGQRFTDLRKVEHATEAPYHQEGDVYRHTLKVVKALQSTALLLGFKRLVEILSADTVRFPIFGKVGKRFPRERGGRYRLMLNLVGSELVWSAILHDTGKSQTRRVSEDGKITFKNHAQVSATQAAKFSQDLKFSKEEADNLVYLVRQHLRIWDFSQMKFTKQHTLYQHKAFPALVLLGFADRLGNLPVGLSKIAAEKLFNSIEEYIVLKTKLSKEAKLRLPVTGKDVMKAGIPQGPQVGQILSTLNDKWKNYLDEHQQSPDKKLVEQWLKQEVVKFI